MADTDRWLEKNGFHCASLEARITLEQCVDNRMKAQKMQFPGLLGACLQCDCAGGGEAKSPQAAVAAAAQQIATREMDWLKASDPAPALVRTLSAPPSSLLTISFAGYEAEFEKLKALSEADGHTLEDDALTILLLFIEGRLMVTEDGE